MYSSDTKGSDSKASEGKDQTPGEVKIVPLQVVMSDLDAAEAGSQLLGGPPD